MDVVLDANTVRKLKYYITMYIRNCWINIILIKIALYTLHAILGNIKDLLHWMKENILAERPELFLQDDSV